MVGKTNSINLLSGGDTQTAKYITVADTLANLVQAFENGDTSAYLTPLKEQCDIWLSSGNGNVNFVPKPCIISFTDSKLLLSKYNTMTYGSQYAHVYWFSGLLEGRVYYEIQIGILTSTASTETASSNYEVADVYVSDYSFVDDNITIGNSSADTSGTITEEQLVELENNDHKLIDFYGELFIKMDTRTHNQLVYTCLKNDTVPIVKFITINTSNRNWVLTQKAIVEEEKVMTDAFTISLEDMKSAINGKKTYRQANAPSAIRNFILAQEGTFDLTITTPLGALGMTLYPSLWKDAVNNSRNFEGVITIDTNLSAIGGSNQLNQIVCTAIAWTTEGSTAVDYRYTIIPIEEQASPSGGVEVIEKTADQAGTFTAPLTTDEFNKLAANTATLKLTYMMYGFLPVIVNLANPVSATVESNTTLAYTVGVPLALNVVLLPTITSADLTKIDLSIQIKDSTPITANGNDDKYDSISDYPLLGFAEDVADVPQLAIPKSFLIGSCLYSNGTWNWDSPSGNGIASTKYIDSWLTHINLYTTDINATTLEAILLIKTESTLPGVEAYKRYSTIVHIGGTNSESSSGRLGSEGLFTVYDTTTHKPTYITFEVSGDLTNHLQIPNFKAYQDGADITTTFLTKVYGIKFYLL